MNANVFIDNEPEARSLRDEDFHDRITREREERWDRQERVVLLATEDEVAEQMDQMLAEGYEFDDEGHIIGWPRDPWGDQRLLDQDEEENIT